MEKPIWSDLIIWVEQGAVYKNKDGRYGIDFAKFDSAGIADPIDINLAGRWQLYKNSPAC